VVLIPHPTNGISQKSSEFLKDSKIVITA